MIGKLKHISMPIFYFEKNLAVDYGEGLIIGPVLKSKRHFNSAGGVSENVFLLKH